MKELANYASIQPKKCNEQKKQQQQQQRQNIETETKQQFLAIKCTVMQAQDHEM